MGSIVSSVSDKMHVFMDFSELEICYAVNCHTGDLNLVM